MGTYLSTPVTDKCEEEGTYLTCPNTPLAWGVVDMQGWRKTMEDAHVATTLDEFKVFGVFDGHGGPEVARVCQLYLVSVLKKQPTWDKALQNEPYHGNPADSPLGLALREAFHALDRVIGDPNRRDELVAYRSFKPGPGDRKEIDVIPPPLKLTAGGESTVEEAKTDAGNVSLMDKVHDDDSPKSDTQTQSVANNEGSDETKKEIMYEESVEEEKKGEDEFISKNENDSDSDEAVGHDEALKEDRNMDNEDDDDGEITDETDSSTAGKVSEMFQRLLNMSGASSASHGQVAVQAIAQTPAPAQSPVNPGTAYNFSASTLHGGRMICTLPDHPIHAGATAVVAVIVDKTLMVANAGDSRAVLCRDGGAFPLSYDHKPQQEGEMSRIRKAGGFVNQFGRVNGNLNLSRSIGDLKYKQAYFLPPAEQMITAEPDIIQ
eukprot:scaffold75_cov165-Amphora_coffeaeformis.AAC.15